MQMIAHGLSAGALFILCGEIHERLQTRDLREMGGLWTRLPYLPPFLLFFALASLGLPGLGNFVGEFLILTGTFVVAPWVAVVASTGLIFAVVYALIMVQRALQGPMHGAVANAALAVRRSDEARARDDVCADRAAGRPRPLSATGYRRGACAGTGIRRDVFTTGRPRPLATGVAP